MKIGLKIFAIGLLLAPVSMTWGLNFTADNAVRITEALRGSSFIAGSSVSIDETVDGDLFVAASQVTISEEVSGDVWIASNVIDVTADMGDDVRAAGNVVRIKGDVAGEVWVAGNTVHLDGSVERDVALAGSVIFVNGKVGGNAWIEGESAFIEETISGDVRLKVKEVTFSEDAKILGNLTWVGEEVPEGTEEVVVGSIELVEPKDRHKEMEEYDRGFHFPWYRVISLIVLGVVLLFVMPNYLDRTSSTLKKHPWRTWLTGMLILLLTPLVVVLLAITFVGFSVAGFVFANYIFLWVFMQLFVAVFGTHYLLTVRFKLKWEHPKERWKYIVGLVVVSVLLVLLPFFITFLLGCFAIGAGRKQDMKMLKKHL